MDYRGVSCLDDTCENSLSLSLSLHTLGPPEGSRPEGRESPMSVVCCFARGFSLCLSLFSVFLWGMEGVLRAASAPQSRNSFSLSLSLSRSLSVLYHLCIYIYTHDDF